MRVKIIRGIDPNLRFGPLLSALAYTDEKKSVNFDNDEDFAEDEEYAEFDGGQEEAACSAYEGVRIGTRAHVPYDLEGFNKNAMLIFNAAEPACSSNSQQIQAKMAEIAATFAKFRFEIEQHIYLTRDEIDEKCQEFLQRDFSTYGCVAVVAIALDGLGFDDSTIVRHWRNDGNPTLHSKPKIYIHEVKSQNPSRFKMLNGQLSHRLRYDNYRRGSFYSAPITEEYPDVLCLHLPTWPNDLTTRPMQKLCSKLDELADYDDFVTIIKEAIRDTKPMYRALIYVACTLERRLFLSRTERVVTRL